MRARADDGARRKEAGILLGRLLNEMGNTIAKELIVEGTIFIVTAGTGTAIRLIWKGGKWVIFGTKSVDKIIDWGKYIDKVRKGLKAGKGRNIGILEGSIDGKTTIKFFTVSGEALRKGDIGNPGKRFFQATAEFDSEVKLLEAFAQMYQKRKGVFADLTLISERTVCGSCNLVINQFRRMFPNVNLKVIENVVKR